MGHDIERTGHTQEDCDYAAGSVLVAAANHLANRARDAINRANEPGAKVSTPQLTGLEPLPKRLGRAARGAVGAFRILTSFRPTYPFRDDNLPQAVIHTAHDLVQSAEDGTSREISHLLVQFGPSYQRFRGSRPPTAIGKAIRQAERDLVDHLVHDPTAGPQLEALRQSYQQNPHGHPDELRQFLDTVDYYTSQPKNSRVRRKK